MQRNSRRWGAPTFTLPRGALVHSLAAAAQRLGVPVEFGLRVTGFEEAERDQPVRVQSGGRTFEADVLIGADGIHSEIRSQLLGRSDPRSAFHVGWTGVAELPPSRWSIPVGVQQILLGRNGLRACISTLRDTSPTGELCVYWYATEKRSHGRELLTRDELSALFADFEAPVERLIAHTATLVPFRIQDRPPILRWGRGNVTLIGDAAHAATPDLGQGACMALEDAVLLARGLMQPGGTDVALRRYERSRAPRTAHVNLLSRATSIGSIVDGPGIGPLRHLGARTLMPLAMRAQFELLFRGFDA